MEIGGKMDRDTLKLMASGKYIERNNSYNQEQHNQFVAGALFTYDIIIKTAIEVKRGINANTESNQTNESRLSEKQL